MPLFSLPPFAWRLPWPLPALLAWAGGWAAWGAARGLGLAPTTALLCGLVAAVLAGGLCQGRWRRLLAVAGFPLSALALGLAAAWPPWVWLILVLPPALIYPLRAWSDAPFFPTPARALGGLDGLLGGPAPRRVLDAGCGLGHGLRALHALWPRARIDGLEWSRPLSWAAARFCPWARVQRGDMWAADWSQYDLVYLFQRPESMARAFTKAQREMAPGAWLVSLEFAVPGELPLAGLQAEGRRPLWAYRPGAARVPGVAKHSSTGQPPGR